MTTALWVLLVLPALVGAGLVTAGRAADRVAAAAAVPTALLVTVLAAVVAVGRPAGQVPFLAGLPLAVRVDRLAGAVLVVVAVVAALVLLASLAEVRADGRAVFLGLLLVFVSAVLLTVVARSLLGLLLAWEVMGGTSCALIAFRWREAGVGGSATTAFLTTRAGDLGLYAATGAALAGTGSLDLARLPELTGWPLHLATAGVVAAALGKAAQLPFSFWLARAMQGPSAVSALLHSAAMVAMGGYLLLRLHPLLAATAWAGPLVAWTGVTTAVLLGVVALGQRDLKLLLAASTASQLGFVVLAAGVGAVTAGTLHLLAHAFVKSALFLAAGAWLELLGTRDLARLRGAGHRVPAVGLVFGVAAAALAGLPPLSLWATKDGVLAAALHESPALYAAGLLAAALSSAYAGRALALVLRPAPGEDAERDTPVAPWGAVLPVAPLAGLAAAGGLLALPPVQEAARRALGTAADPAPSGLGLLASALLALVAFALAWRAADPAAPRVPAAVADWLRLEAAAHLLVVRPVLSLATALALFDDRVLARGVDAVGPGALALARGSRRADERGVDGVVRAVVRGVGGLGTQARRPQTGLVHQYFAQAAAVVAVAVVLLLVRR